MFNYNTIKNLFYLASDSIALFCFYHFLDTATLSNIQWFILAPFLLISCFLLSKRIANLIHTSLHYYDEHDPEEDMRNDRVYSFADDKYYYGDEIPKKFAEDYKREYKRQQKKGN